MTYKSLDELIQDDADLVRMEIVLGDPAMVYGDAFFEDGSWRSFKNVGGEWCWDD